jgi:predicted nucleotidyltransferase
VNAIGIIAEYNPFHNGHKWHIEEARRLAAGDIVIAAMSGNFVQRGEPALFDKWARADMAVRGGVDLVVELPVAFVVRSAQHFAAGGIRLLKLLGVNRVCFGTETPQLSDLTALAQAYDNQLVIAQLHQYLDSGLTYAAAMGKALVACTGIDHAIISSPNNILAVEYLRAIAKYAPHLQPLAIARKGAKHGDSQITGTFASASAIRSAIIKDKCIDKDTASVLPASSIQCINALLEQQQGPVTMAQFEQIILAKLRTDSLVSLEKLCDINEGLHVKMKDSALRAESLESLLIKLKSKRYSRTRLQRIAIQALLNIYKGNVNSFDETGPLYIRVLAFNENGRKLLKKLAANSEVPIITKTTHELNSRQRDCAPQTQLQKMLTLDTVASDIYCLGQPGIKWRSGGQDFRTSPAYIPHSTDE